MVAMLTTKNTITAMKNLPRLNADLVEAQQELEDIYTMSEEAACFRYQVDSKDEIIQMMNEAIDSIISDIDKATALLAPVTSIDPAFRSMADFDRMRI